MTSCPLDCPGRRSAWNGWRMPREVCVRNIPFCPVWPPADLLPNNSSRSLQEGEGGRYQESMNFARVA